MVYSQLSDPTASRLFRRSLVAVAVLAATPTLAQVEDTRNVALEEVIITAQKRQESIQMTPVAVTAFTAEGLESLGVVDVGGIAERVPNTMLVQQPSSNVNLVASIRGIHSTEVSLAQDAKVGLYLDGVYIGKSSGAIFDIADLERVEVLRGPQGTLYGKNTTAGAINLITEQPLGEFGFRQKLTAGNYGRVRSQTTVDLPRTDFGLATKLSYMTREFDGWARNVNPRGPRQLGRDDTSGYRLAFNWQFTDRLTADYSYDRTYGVGTAKGAQLSWVNPAYAQMDLLDKDGNLLYSAGNADHPFQQMLDSGLADQKGRQRVFNLDGANEERYDVRGHGLTLSYDFDDFELKSISGYREVNIRLKPGATDLDGGAWSVPVFHNATVANNGNRKTSEAYSQDFQIIGLALDDRLDYVGGLYYYQDKGDERNSLWDTIVPAYDQQGRPVLGPNGQPALQVSDQQGQTYSVKSESYAIYGQASYTPPVLDDQLTLTLGLRQTWDIKEAKVQGVGRVKKRWDNFNPTLTVDYELSADASVYAKVATGYTAGSHPIRATSLAALRLAADPEKVINYELGLKSDWLSRRLRVNAAVFHYDYTDMQIDDFQDGSTITANAGKARLQGAELEVTALPIAGLVLDLSYGYLDFDYRKYRVSDPTAPGGFLDASGVARAANAPRHTGRFNAAYEFTPLPIGVFTAALEVTHTGRHHFNPRNYQHDAAGERTLLNARLSLADIPVSQGTLRAALWGRNLENKEYREYGIDFGAVGHAINTWGDPRTYGVDLVYEY